MRFPWRSKQVEPTERRYVRGTPETRFAAYLEPAENGCIEWRGSRNGRGYGTFTQPGHKTILAHRYAYKLANGEIPAGLCVLHRCDNPACCNVDHLFLGTRADNNRDMREKGRDRQGSLFQNGEAHPRSKLTSDAVRAIRKRYGTGTTLAELAGEYGVTESTVSRVVRHEIWKEVA